MSTVQMAAPAQTTFDAIAVSSTNAVLQAQPPSAVLQAQPIAAPTTRPSAFPFDTANMVQWPPATGEQYAMLAGKRPGRRDGFWGEGWLRVGGLGQSGR